MISFSLLLFLFEIFAISDPPLVAKAAISL